MFAPRRKGTAVPHCVRNDEFDLSFDAHFGVGEFEDASGEEDQAHGESDEEDTRGASVGLEEEAAERVHGKGRV